MESRLKINLDKSRFVYSKVTCEGHRETLRLHLGIHHTTNLGSYLHFKTPTGRMWKADFQDLIDKSSHPLAADSPAWTSGPAGGPSPAMPHLPRALDAPRSEPKRGGDWRSEPERGGDRRLEPVKGGNRRKAVPMVTVSVARAFEWFHRRVSNLAQISSDLGVFRRLQRRPFQRLFVAFERFHRRVSNIAQILSDLGVFRRLQRCPFQRLSVAFERFHPTRLEPRPDPV
ncbi:hypothetical protein VNO78_33566 [Psophocarpus tetragonolobus]|uniref:Uncharacterized protein n=1 Tax=Psophocarpus tetragonolobus TaxID=3891 RepID=A0AAN9NYA8_PSOTE